MADKPPLRIGLVGCTKSKRSGQWPAEQLYSPSDLFCLRRDHVRHTCADWFIVSAYYGLLEPTEVVGYYQWTMRDLRKEGRVGPWTRNTVSRLAQFYPPSDVEVVEIHAGREYADVLAPELERLCYKVEILPPDRMAIGLQKRWYEYQASRG